MAINKRKQEYTTSKIQRAMKISLYRGIYLKYFHIVRNHSLAKKFVGGLWYRLLTLILEVLGSILGFRCLQSLDRPIRCFAHIIVPLCPSVKGYLAMFGPTGRAVIRPVATMSD